MPRNGYIKVDEVPDSLNPKLFVVKEDISQFECPLCLEVFNDPKQCKRGHVFCRECIVEALKKCENCPICSEPLTEATMSSCLFVKQQIASRQVYCFTRLDELEATGEDKEEKNGAKKEGRKKAKIADVCTWTGKLEDAEKHFHACPYAGVLCKYAPECNLADYRKDIHEHEKNCCYRTVPCKWCGVELKPNGPLAQHQALCDKQEVPCSNWGYGCRLKVPKDELKLHETTCGWFRVPCPLAGDDSPLFISIYYYPYCTLVTSLFILYHLILCISQLLRDALLGFAAKTLTRIWQRQHSSTTSCS